MVDYPIWPPEFPSLLRALRCLWGLRSQSRLGLLCLTSEHSRVSVLSEYTLFSTLPFPLLLSDTSSSPLDLHPEWPWFPSLFLLLLLAIQHLVYPQTFRDDFAIVKPCPSGTWFKNPSPGTQYLLVPPQSIFLALWYRKNGQLQVKDKVCPLHASLSRTS